jgi:hypothetical protein
LIININPVHCEGLNCFEEIIVTLASYYNVEYRCAFSGAWGFEFKPSDGAENSLLGERIGNGDSNILNMLYRYCKVENHMKYLKLLKSTYYKKYPLPFF